jgi:hypothetical protein
MSDFIDFLELARKGDNSVKPKSSIVFEFPFTNDYFNWVDIKSQKFPIGRKPKNFWTDFYNEIIEREIKPAGVNIPNVWYTRLISYPTMSVYLIGDLNDKLLYIGKCEYSPIIRILDRMIPKRLNQMNNVPQIWDNYISQGKKVNCTFVYDLDYDPEILESLLLRKYIARYDTLPKFNKKGPR